MNILFVHQNYPGQFKFLGPELVKQGHTVSALCLRADLGESLHGVKIHNYAVHRGSTENIHPWLTDFETKVIRGEACFNHALKLRDSGYYPDVIVAHHGWGESLFLKDVWPDSKLGIYCEFFYHSSGFDVGFDREFLSDESTSKSLLRLKNINNTLHFEIADAGLSPTNFQASTFPDPFRSKITVIHDGLDFNLLRPNPDVRLSLSSRISFSSSDEIITFVNRNLEPYRGYHIFMRALPRLLKLRPNAHVFIVGGNGVSYGASPLSSNWKSIFASEVRDLIDDSAWSRVHFLGNISYANYLSLLQLSTVHVYLTYPFVLSWSLLESLAIGCAVVASDTAPVSEVITHKFNGLLVDFFDSKALTDCICQLLSDSSLRQRLSSNARKQAKALYCLHDVCLPKQIQWIDKLSQL